MNSDRHRQIKEIFLEAILLSPQKQRELLDQRCVEDADLRREIEKLLGHHTDETLPATAAAPTATAETDFRAGVILADRYRVVTQIGKGGMGEVYRVEDLKLGQTIALKFLAADMASEPNWRERFMSEARLAHTVTHPNVCRVFDVGEVEGRPFISMEYIEGEDLASLFRRIGRLPVEKACELSVQLCAGIEAAHSQGVLHRDLKPANIHLDDRGRIRITDFGLAGIIDRIPGAEIRSGTPAYMAPEQIAGREVTVRSDIYALGLVLYEMLSGTPVFDAEKVAEFAHCHQHEKPTPLEQRVADVPPEVAQVIMTCLAKVPEDRPARAMIVAAALTGQDPLSAALAAHTIPSPELVAGATPRAGGRFSSGRMLVALAVMLAGLLGMRANARAPWEAADARPPDVLASKARSILKIAGFTNSPDQAHGYCAVEDAARLADGYAGWFDAGDELAARYHNAVLFWYRTSERRLTPGRAENVLFGSGRVTPSDPPQAAGMQNVVLDLDGRLLLLAVTPSAGTEFASGLDPGDRWQHLLDRAGIEAAACADFESQLATAYRSDGPARGCIAPNPAHAETRAQVISQTDQGLPSFLAVTAPVNELSDSWLDKIARRTLVQATSEIVLTLLALMALPWAWSHYRSGRWDRTGSMRLALFMLIARFMIWVLQARHTPVLQLEFEHLSYAALRGLGEAALMWIFYVALEPHARRHWPQMLITWTRLLTGRYNDGFLGRHILLGCMLGIFWAYIGVLDRAAVGWMGLTPRPLLLQDQLAEQLLGGRHAIAGCIVALRAGVFQGLLLLLLLATMRRLVRDPATALGLTVLVLLPMYLPRTSHAFVGLVTVGLGGIGVACWVMTRYGMVTLSCGLFVSAVLNNFPLALDGWHADLALTALAVVAALVLVGFRWAQSDGYQRVQP